MVGSHLHADIATSVVADVLDLAVFENCFGNECTVYWDSHAENDSSLLHETDVNIPWILARTFRILLVEEDECGQDCSTSSLLRSCGYEVTSIRNCLDAWKFLLSNFQQVDLVIIDVFLPGFSGINLLSLINGLSHLKHVPVIMISSQDSMDVIFECLSNGAVDVLIRPLRKNELKNIWQHIWRRSCSLKIGGEATQSIVSPQQLGSIVSSAQECDFGVSCNTGDESDACSGTQGLWRISKDRHDEDEVGLDNNLAHLKSVESSKQESMNYAPDAFLDPNHGGSSFIPIDGNDASKEKCPDSLHVDSEEGISTFTGPLPEP